MSFFNRSILSAALFFGLLPVCTAQQTLDKIIIKIGRNRIILLSELEVQAQQAKQQDPNFNDSGKCALLQSMILSKMLVEQADRDSVSVTDEDVEGQLDNRIRYFTQVYGSKEKLEQVSGRTVYQMKEDYRDVVREQMLAEKVNQQVMEHVKITPAEVEKFYNNIPKDSLPFFPASLEVGQIVIDPPVSVEMEEYAHKKMEDIRNDVMSGKMNFETAAGFYSEDPGSRDEGGLYENVKKDGGFAPEFVAAAFKLQNGEVSPIVKTQFGYHIIQMVKRKGDEANLRHILIKPTVTSADFAKALAKLDSVRNLIVSGKYSFSEAVGKFSTDEAAKRTGGMVMDPTTGSTILDQSKLDQGMVMMMDTLGEGKVSAPHVFMTDRREKSCRIVFLRSRTAPHRANLVEDYARLQDVALQHKKQLKMQDWVVSKIPTFYLWIAPEYRDCPVLRNWVVKED